MACMADDQHRCADQAVRNVNHGIRARGWDQLGTEAGRRRQHAENHDAAADHDGARQIARPYGREEVR
jgi:hypothetical protein